MTTPFERSLFDRPVGDFDWGPQQRWRTTATRFKSASLIVLGILAVAWAILRVVPI